MKRKVKRIFLIFIALSFVCVGIASFTYAKYVYNSTWNKYLVSKDFYMSSDSLGITAINNVDNLWDGGDVNFNVKNYENEEAITGYDILYDATCSISGDAASHVACYINGTSSSTASGVLSSSQKCINNTEDGVNVNDYTKTNCELEGYVWKNQMAIKDLYFNVVLIDPNYIIEDIEASITVSSYSPYSKTLKGNYILHKAKLEGNNAILSYDNYDNYDRLNIYNPSDLNKCVEISWDSSKLKIENSAFISYQVDSNDYINSIKTNINSKGSVSYIFYKDNLDENYTVDEFTLVNSGGC